MSEAGRILIVDDDEAARTALCRALKASGFSCAAIRDGAEGLERMRAGDFDVALIDLGTASRGAGGLLGAMREAGVETPAIVLAGPGEARQAAEAVKRGAFDFLEKSAGIDSVRRAVERASKRRRALRRARVMTQLARQLEAVFDATSDMILVLDSDSRILRASRALLDRMNCKKEALIGRPCHEALCGSAHLPADCPFGQSLRDRSSCTVELAPAGWGGRFQLASEPLPDGSEELWGSMHVLRDVAAGRGAEEQLREAHAQSELLISSISAILVCLDEDWRITQWNAQAARALAVPSEAAVGRPLLECGVRWDIGRVRAALSECVTHGRPVRVDDIRFTRPNGKEGFIAMTLSPLRGHGPGQRGVLILARDITERKCLEAQLMQAQKLEGIGQLAAGIAHEINTPLQYVQDNTRFLEDCFGELVDVLGRYNRLLSRTEPEALPPQLRAEVEALAEKADLGYLAAEIPRAIQQSLEGIARVTKIIRAMREFSHPGVEEKAAIDINQAIESTLTISRNEWKYVAEVETDFDPDLPPVLCLPGELNHVILSLIVNAAHAIADAPREGPQTKGTIRLTTRRDGDWAEIRVSDTGTGIPQEIASRVFDPFFTTKDVGKGSGQGLTIAHAVVVDKHAGTIRFETDLGKGTTFIVRLPIGGKPQAADPAAREAVHAG